MKYTLNKDGKVKQVQEDAIIIDGSEEMKKYYVVRLIKVTFSGAKYVLQRKFSMKSQHRIKSCGV